MRRLLEALDAAAPVGPGRRRVLWLGLLLALACAVAGTAWRMGPLAQWAPGSGAHQAGGVPIMTTLDAYYSLRIARLQAQGRFVAHGPVPERHYARPEQGQPDQWYDQREPKTLPLLSGLIAAVSSTLGTGIDRSALLLPPLLSGLFMLPLFLCLFQLGLPAAGVLGGLATTFCLDYLQRTSLGWVDTDALNLFFPWTVAALFLAMSQRVSAPSARRLLALSAAAGAVLFVYGRWYPKPAMPLLFAAALLLHLRLAGVPWRRTLACVATLLLLAGPAQLLHAAASLQDFAQRYLAGDVGAPSAGPTAPGLQFPSVWPTISEARHLPWPQTLQQVVRRADLGVVGLLGLLPLLLWRWRSMAALLPLMLLGALALMSSRRFTPYLAPFIGIGWGVLLSLLLAPAWRRWATPAGAGPASGPKAVLATAVAAVLVYAVALSPAGLGRVMPAPAVPAPVFASLQALKGQLPPGSRLWTWWDLGFAIVDTTGYGAYHDGSAQYTPQTALVATSLTHDDPAVLATLMRYVDHAGNRGIRPLAAQVGDEAGLLARIGREKPDVATAPQYVLFTPDLLLKFGTLQAMRPRARGAAAPTAGGAQWLDCQRLELGVLHCGPRRINLGNGEVQLDGRPVARLRRSVLVADGRVLSETDHGAGPPGEPEATVQVVREGPAVRAVYVLDEPAYRSNLNQMFTLGRYDPAHFEEVLNRAPYARVYRLRQP